MFTIILSIPFFLIALILFGSSIIGNDKTGASNEMVLFIRIGMFLVAFFPLAIGWWLFTY